MTRTLFALLALAPFGATAGTLDLSQSGRLLDSVGNPVNGSHTVTLSLYNAADAQLWTHDYADLQIEGGYYSVVLTGLDSAWFSGDVTLGVSLDLATELSPRQALVSVPNALSADIATRIPTDTDGAVGTCPAEGAIIWDRASQAVKVCNDSLTWVSVSPPLIVLSSGVRRWSDGSDSASCDSYRHPSGGRQYEGDVGDGLYEIDPDGAGGAAAFDVYCDMTTDDGGWTLLFNLDTSDGANHEYQDTTWWTTNSVEGSPGLATGHKSAAFSTVSGWDEVLMRVHNSGTPYGHAIRPLLPAHADSTFENIMDAGNNVVFTGTASTITGDVGTILNPDRVQTLHGDIFMEFSHALKANSTSSWGAAENVNRLSTTLTNTNYGHTFAGLGGRHQNGIGSYGTRYEAAPISAYCDLRNGYGNGSNMISAHGSYPYSSSCKNGAFSWIPADTALFVR